MRPGEIELHTGIMSAVFFVGCSEAVLPGAAGQVEIVEAVGRGRSAKATQTGGTGQEYFFPAPLADSATKRVCSIWRS